MKVGMSTILIGALLGGAWPAAALPDTDPRDEEGQVEATPAEVEAEQTLQNLLARLKRSEKEASDAPTPRAALMQSHGIQEDLIRDGTGVLTTGDRQAKKAPTELSAQLDNDNYQPTPSPQSAHVGHGEDLYLRVEDLARKMRVHVPPRTGFVFDKQTVGLGSAEQERVGLTARLSVRDLVGRRSDADGEVTATLADRMMELVALGDSDAEVALSLAASLYEHWKAPAQSEFIFDQVAAMGEQLSHGRGLEATLTFIRRFVQEVDSEQLRNRAQLRMGRLYYEHGYHAKAIVELPVDLTEQNPDRYQTLAGLVKAISLVRLRQTGGAIPLLEWVAQRSVDSEQQARAALLLGRLHLLYQRHDEARRWLEAVARTTAIAEQAKEAKELLAKLNTNPKG